MAAAASASNAAALVAWWARRSPRGASAIRRQWRPCSARMSTSSALPACLRTLIQRSAGPTGWVTTRVPCAIRQPAATSRSPRSESSRYARGKRSSKPPTATSASRRTAMSAVAQVASRRPATLRSQSVGRRPAGRGTCTRPCEAPTPETGAARSSQSRADHPVGGTTSSSRKTIQDARDARQPALRAAAGPRPGPRMTLAPGASSGVPSGRSSTTITRETPSARSAASSRPSDGRPTVGTTISIAGSVTARRPPPSRGPARRPSRGGGRRRARSRGDRPARTRSTPARRAGRRPSGVPRCSGTC